MSYIWPVIHHINNKTSLEEAEIASKNKCFGVFLISMNGRDNTLTEIGLLVKEKFPNLLIGINRLSCNNFLSLKENVNNGFNATWVDCAEITGKEVSSRAISTAKFLKANCPSHIYFAGIAFKYQRREISPDLAANNAQFLGFIPTTSGPGTGQAAALEKIKLMSEATEGTLGLASGVTLENVSDYLPYVSHILVNTGIATNGRLDDKKLSKLMEKVRV